MKSSSGKFLNLVHYFPYDVKLGVLADSRSFLANQKARNAIVGAENLLNYVMPAGSHPDMHQHGVSNQINLGSKISPYI